MEVHEKEMKFQRDDFTVKVLYDEYSRDWVVVKSDTLEEDWFTGKKSAAIYALYQLGILSEPPISETHRAPDRTSA